MTKVITSEERLAPEAAPPPRPARPTVNGLAAGL
jgi:hypothetical protein